MAVDPPFHSTTRRRFLASLGWLLGMLAVPFQMLFRSRSRLSNERRPVWHPQASGFHDDGHLTIRRTLSPGVCRETILHNVEARLWCLCGGARSESELAQILTAENALSPEQAEATVRAFLTPLYRDGFLTVADEQLAEQRPEVETEPGYREFPCRRATS